MKHNIVNLVQKTKSSSVIGFPNIVDVRSLSGGRQINVIQEPKVKKHARNF